jgi:hypothetical protein
VRAAPFDNPVTPFDSTATVQASRLNATPIVLGPPIPQISSSCCSLHKKDLQIKSSCEI